MPTFVWIIDYILSLSMRKGNFCPEFRPLDFFNFLLSFSLWIPSILSWVLVSGFLPFCPEFQPLDSFLWSISNVLYIEFSRIFFIFWKGILPSLLNIQTWKCLTPKILTNFHWHHIYNRVNLNKVIHQV